MRFICDKCHAKYSIADDKVQKKVLKIRCKKCSNVIIVSDSPSSASSPPVEATSATLATISSLSSASLSSIPGPQPSSSPAPSHQKAQPSSLHRPSSSPSPDRILQAGSHSSVVVKETHPPPDDDDENFEQKSERTMVARISVNWFRQIQQEQHEQPTWFYSFHNSPVGPVTLSEVIQRIQKGEIAPAGLVWKAGWPNWTSAEQVQELREAFQQPTHDGGDISRALGWLGSASSSGAMPTFQAPSHLSQPAPSEPPKEERKPSPSPQRSLLASSPSPSQPQKAETSVFSPSPQPSSQPSSSRPSAFPSLSPAPSPFGSSVNPAPSAFGTPRPSTPAPSHGPSPAPSFQAQVPSISEPSPSSQPFSTPTNPFSSPSPRPAAPFEFRSSPAPAPSPQKPAPFQTPLQTPRSPQPTPSPSAAPSPASTPQKSPTRPTPAAPSAPSPSPSSFSPLQPTPQTPPFSPPKPAPSSRPELRQDIAMESHAIPASLDLVESNEEALFFDRAANAEKTGADVFEVELPPLPSSQAEDSFSPSLELSIDEADIIEISETIKPKQGRTLLAVGGVLGLVLLLMISLAAPNSPIRLHKPTVEPKNSTEPTQGNASLSKEEEERRLALLGGGISAKNAAPPPNTPALRRRPSRARTVERAAETPNTPDPSEKPTPARLNPQSSIDEEIQRKAAQRLRERGISFPVPSSSSPSSVSGASHVDPKLMRQIVKEITTNQGKVQFCYEQHLKKVSFQGRIELQIRITPSGFVEGATITPEKHRGLLLVKCIASSAKRWQFSPFQGETLTIAVPFDFQPSY